MDVYSKLFMGDRVAPEAFSTPLPDSVAVEVVERLKEEADRYWSIDPQRSLVLADRIIAIGRRRFDVRQTALGLMARGDALKLIGQMKEAWESLEEAGDLYESVGDEVGWARTRIGRLDLGVKLNHVPETLADAERARAIFTHYGRKEKLLRLNINTAVVHERLGDPDQALRIYRSALISAETLGEIGQQYLGHLYLNIGSVHETLGDFRQALDYYEQARVLLTARGDTKLIAMTKINIAYIAQAQGHYHRSLDILHGVLASISERYPLEAAQAKADLVECYLYLNRYRDAQELAHQVIAEFRIYDDDYELACTLLHLATAEAELSHFNAGQEVLEEAESIFTKLGAKRWVATIHLLRGRMALNQGGATLAYREAAAAAAFFESGGQRVKYATATLLQGRALFALRNYDASAEAGAIALRVARRYNVPSLRYTAHLLLGQIAEAQQRTTRAMRRYRAAAATVERVQRHLTITLRPGFLEDKGEASRALIALYLRARQTGEAFETLERAKSQVLLGYLANQERLRWARDDVRSQNLIKELEQLRAEHQWFYRLAHDPPRDDEFPSAVQPEDALVQVATRERRMRAITEQLYLHSGNGQRANRAPLTSLSDIQTTLNNNMLMIEFYNDGTHLWAFILDGQSIEVRRLPIAVEALNQMLTQLQANVAAALKVDRHAAAAHYLTSLAQRILQRLYLSLIKPLELHRYDWKRLVIVPYGALHYLPFHLLYDGSAYMIERGEVVILPAASLMTQPAPQRESGALILAHSRGGLLSHTLAEAQMVQRLFGGTLYVEEAADRSVLQTQPAQILHIAAHGQFRLDQPDLSYLQLADGQLYADDLLQQDMGYELVTLSACETGRADVAAADELVGLGRGFLYAGAGALLVSLWQVADDSALHLMEQFYKALRAGASKAAALREAQQIILAEDFQRHPAHWGAFQLIGNGNALSQQHSRRTDDVD